MRLRSASAAVAAAALGMLAGPTIPASAGTAPRAREPHVVDAPDFGTRVLVVGDSLTVGTLYCRPPYPCLTTLLAERGIRPVLRPDAVVGRRVAEGMAVLRTASRHLTRGTTVVIALGTNDLGANRATARGWVAQARRIVGPAVTIAWVDVRVSNPSWRTAQQALDLGLRDGITADDTAQQAAGHAGRSALLSWSTYAADRAIPHGRDGIHYTPAGYQLRAAFYAGALAGDPAFDRYVRS